ncbi:MAG: GntR family transcriptional regulator, partial [Planctomycetota bacterium]|nr:GntR family transcriptional regulator [Planctomycetota bacterium]
MGRHHTVIPPLHVHLQPHGGPPLYRQIVDEVKSAFLRGALQPGEKLPSVRELAATLGINPTTVVKAYDTLAHERLIVRRQGQGAFVQAGEQPLHEDEKDSQLAELARRLAVEGRRLGRTETELVELLRDQLRALRPPKKSSR